MVILGTASFIPDETHENTHMLLQGEQGYVLIDSGSNPLISLKKAGLSADQLRTLILTHFHPDHMSGVPNLLMGLWLMGRTQPLNILGLNVTLDKIHSLMNLFEWRDWPGFYPVTFEPVQSFTGSTILEMPDFHIQMSPAHHLVPSIALKVTAQAGGKTLVYSSDTSPSDAVAQRRAARTSCARKMRRGLRPLQSVHAARLPGRRAWAGWRSSTITLI
jgi:ribonuclease Z